jgi:hypothetical protein
MAGRWRGIIDYVGDGVGVRGREEWQLSVRADGTRTLRAHCEMWDSGIVRDVVHTVSAGFVPLRSFITQDVGGIFQGEGWFAFGPTHLESMIVHGGAGRVDQLEPLTAPVPFFIPHAVACDAWIPAGFDPAGSRTQVLAGGWRSSPRANGASGPLAEAMAPVRVSLLAEESVRVPAGTIATRRFALDQPDGQHDEVWVGVEQRGLLVQLRCDALNSWYRLAELERMPDRTRSRAQGGNGGP